MADGPCIGGLPRPRPGVDAARSGAPHFDTFRNALDQGLKRLALTEGRDVSGIEKAYNAGWPDGRKMAIARHRAGGYTVRFSDGGAVRLPDLNALGAAAMLMRDPALYEQVRRRHS